MLAQRYFNDPGARIAALTSVATCSADQKIKIFKKNLDNVWEPETEWKVSWYEQLSRRSSGLRRGGLKRYIARVLVDIHTTGVVGRLACACYCSTVTHPRLCPPKPQPPCFPPRTQAFAPLRRLGCTCSRLRFQAPSYRGSTPQNLANIPLSPPPFPHPFHLSPSCSLLMTGS